MSIISHVVDGPIAIVTIDRSVVPTPPPQEMLHGLVPMFRRLGADKNVRAIILAGLGEHVDARSAVPRACSIEVDLAINANHGLAIDACCDAVAGIPQPVIAVISGRYLGAECQLSIACDFRFADPSASFEMTAANNSIVYGARSTKRLLSLVGSSNAKRLLYGAERVGVRDALQIGFVDRLSDDPLGDAHGFALQLSRKAPLSISGAKYILNNAAMADGGLLGQALVDHACDSDDYLEGRRAFLNKRQPRFNWR